MTTDIGQRIYQQALALSFPRYPGTAGDRRAIRDVAERLETAGLEVSIEEFSYDLTRVWWLLRGVLLFGAGAILVAGVAAADRPAVSLVAVLLALLVAMSLLTWSPWLERLYAADGPTVTANVCARSGPRAASRTVIVLAHHDSKSQNLTMLQRGALTLVALLATAGVTISAVLAQAGRPLSVAGWVAPGLGVAGALALLILSTLRSGDSSPGGVDNAGSLAILLELAGSLPQAIADPATELIFLSPGAEEDHMVGAMRWLERHRAEFSDRPVKALNMDGAGAPGRLVLLERYGFGRRFSPELSRLAREVARDQQVAVRGVLLPPAMGIDAIPFVNRGIECLTLSSGSLDSATLAVHSSRDRAEHLSPEVLEQAYRLALETVRRLAVGERHD